ncbi:Rieske Fe-S protein [Rivularia sp. PCC 7116]|uniref:QcrA and Rieske domain-containing protein n=1 Tax=Rivularia sp. PCC 7116 TaxID=373994 RepID=UPI00029ED405|nr:ubiquinol-cytochrome c reductase iron-sulfur subunit [Rivularia sp. PCC 7116]AFY53680.1 Rieske Fe-S protein [Rivularia sp. PCC 7116]
MNRRSFLNWVGIGWIASCLPVAIAACSSKETKQNASESQEWQEVGTSSELNTNEKLLSKNKSGGEVLLVKTSVPGDLVAVNPTCTHSGCTVEWKADMNKFVCPCHGSEFGVAGKVEKAPATTPLKTYAVKVEGEKVLIR